MIQTRIPVLASLVIMSCCSGYLGCVDETEPPPWVTSVAFLDSSEIFMATWDGRYHRSEDGGVSWSVVGRGNAVWDMVSGSAGAVWGLTSVSSNPRNGKSILARHEPAISLDRGESFSVFKTDRTSVFPLGLVELRGTNPLVFSFLSDQLWMPQFDVQAGAGSLDTWGFPVTNGEFPMVTDAIECGGRVLVATMWNDHDDPAVIWSTSDSGESWVSELELQYPDYLTHLACGSTDDLWAISNQLVVFRQDDGSDAWIEIVRLGESEHPDGGLRRPNIATDGDRLFVAGASAEFDPIALSVSADGSVTELAAPPTVLWNIKIDREGSLWGWGSSSALLTYDSVAARWRQVWPKD